jgi:hypothetical protein
VNGDRIGFSGVEATSSNAGCFSFADMTVGVVADSIVRDCTGPGVLVGPDARNVGVGNNLLERNGRAVVFEGEELPDETYRRPHDTAVAANVIRNSVLEGGEWQVEGTFDPDESWADNAVAGNCLFQPDGMNVQDPRTAFSADDNEIAEACASEYGPRTRPVYPPPPQADATFNVAPAARPRASGVASTEVEVEPTGTRAEGFLPLIAAAQVNLGSVVDTTHGAAALTLTSGSLTVWGGAAKVRQRGTEVLLRLTGSYVGAKGRAASHRRKRRQWGKGKCRRCSIRGRYGKASHPRSEFLVEDRCKGTRVFVREGSVRFKDFLTGRSFRVREGDSYIAKPKRRRRPC